MRFPLAGSGCSSPATAAWSAARSCAGWRARTARSSRSGAARSICAVRPDRGAGSHRRRPDAVFLAAATRRRHPGQRHAPGGIPLRKPDDRRQCDRGGAPRRGREAAVSRLVLHLSAPRAAADARGSAADRPARADQQWYAVAKIAGLKLCAGLSPATWLRLHLGACRPTSTARTTISICREATSLPALLARSHQAKIAGAAAVEIWGTGRPQREFLHVDDLADALVFLMQTYSGEQQINIGWGKESRSPNSPR